MPVDPGQVEEEANTDEELRRALGLVYRELNRRERTEAELRAALTRRKVGADAAESALATVREAGYLDDAGYARRFAEDRRTLDGWGPDRIERDLARRGVDAGLIEEALAARSRDDELLAAERVLAERLPAAPRDDRERDRAWRLLVRRGYPPELAYDAVRAREDDAGRE